MNFLLKQYCFSRHARAKRAASWMMSLFSRAHCFSRARAKRACAAHARLKALMYGRLAACGRLIAGLLILKPPAAKTPDFVRAAAASLPYIGAFNTFGGPHGYGTGLQACQAREGARKSNPSHEYGTLRTD